jgi:hypothetical protein
MVLLLLLSCNRDPGTTTIVGEVDRELPAGLSDTLMAPLITYSVIVKNPDPEDTWTAECLQYLDMQGFINEIFSGIYEGRIQPIHYHEKRPMALKEIEELEKNPKFARENIGKIQFVESWDYDPNRQSFVKKVKSVMLAYELYDLEGRVRGYSAAFEVSMDNPVME